MGFKKISELDPAVSVNDGDLFAGVKEDNNELDNKKYTAGQLKSYFQEGLQTELTFDSSPKEGSLNPVRSNGIHESYNTLKNAIQDVEANTIPVSQKGHSNGVAELDGSGKVPSAQLPSYVDDVLEYASASYFPFTGEGGKIYIALDMNKTYRWSGTQYTEISPSLALGETSSTAYRGDRGKTAYEFSQSSYTSSPAMNGTASAGSSNSWARGDHVHPKDTSKQDLLTFDNTPTENSSNPVKSGGVYSALSSKQDALTFDNVPTENSNNPVKSGGLYSALSSKQDTLTFDNVPTENSNNPVKSSGIYDLASILAGILNSNGVYPTDTTSGNTVSFPDGADNVPVVDLKVGIELVQSGSGDPSPTNVRPISGWTGMTLYHSGADTSDPETLSVSWQSEAGTVYGGTLDVTMGTLTVDRIGVDLGALTWALDSAYSEFNRFVATRSNLSVYDDCICEVLGIATSPDGVCQTNNTIKLAPNSGKIIARADAYSTAEAFTSAVNGHLFVYGLATPNAPITLTLTEVKTLLGENNIWANTGAVTMEYRADAKLYIDKKLSELLS